MYVILIAVLIIILLGVIFLPQVWLTRTLNKHYLPEDKFPGTGAEFARHLLKKMDIQDVSVESTTTGDHYDPTDKTVRLGEKHYDGRSLTAIVIAAHEVGHAIQHKSNYRFFNLRKHLATVAIIAEKTGVLIFMIMPVLTLITRNPLVGVITTSSAIGMLALGVLVHLITLPVEWDASFNRALPLLKAGQYIDKEDQPAARKILKAAASTYLAGALASLLNLSRWLAILKK